MKIFHKPIISRTETTNTDLKVVLPFLAKTILGKLNSAYVLMDLEDFGKLLLNRENNVKFFGQVRDSWI